MAESSSSSIPVVELADGDGLIDAFSTTGFAAVQGHGVQGGELAAMRRLLVGLFAIDDATKRRYAVRPDNYRGFIPLRFFTPNREHDAPANGFEGYKLHWECPPGHPVRGECSLYGSNRWPDQLPEMPEVVAGWWCAMQGLADRLLVILASGLGLDPEVLLREMEAPLTNVTLLHYPAKQPYDRSPGFHPHKDISVVTVLDPDPVGGLEVRTRDGQWVEAICPEDALLVNVGDVLEVWSGGRLVSTPHRVTNVAGAERYSAPFFVVPNHAVVAEPLLEPLDHFETRSIPMGYVQSEVWRTNWPDEEALDVDTHLGGVD